MEIVQFNVAKCANIYAKYLTVYCMHFEVPSIITRHNRREYSNQKFETGLNIEVIYDKHIFSRKLAVLYNKC